MRHVVVVIPDPEGRGYTVTVPALPGCVTQGTSLDAAIANARDAIAEYLDGETSESLAAAGAYSDAIVAEISVPT